jgi:hypothetical protein
MALDTVQDYIDRARGILVDSVEPYRYPDQDLVEALNMAVMEARRLRPELMRSFFRGSLPEFQASDTTAAVPIDPMYRSAFLYYVCGHAHLRDDEVTTDSRAAGFLNKFVAQLLTQQA